MNITNRFARIYPKVILIIAFFIFILAYTFPIMESHWERNNLALRITHSLIDGETALQSTAYMGLSSLGIDPCWKSWFLGITFDVLGDLEQRDMAREATLHCSPAYIPLLRAVAPGELHLAELAVQFYPEIPQAWFWLADIHFQDSPDKAVYAYRQGLQRQPHHEYAWVQIGKALASLGAQDALSVYERLDLENINARDPGLNAEVQFILAAALSKSQPRRAIELYRQGLELKPFDGVRWYELGDLLVDIDPQSAIEAYLQSCNHGDPGKNGCYRAGRTAESLGDIQAAIVYYRLSKWQKALDRALQLELALP